MSLIYDQRELLNEDERQAFGFSGRYSRIIYE